MGRYITGHWQGRQPLWQSFWVNLVLVTLAIGVAELILYQNLESGSRRLIWIMVAWFAVFHILVFTWQATGVVRASESRLGELVHTVWPRAALIGVVVAFGGVMVWGVSLLQYLVSDHTEQMLRIGSLQPRPDYTLSIMGENLRITGFLAPGITRETRQLLESNHSIRAVEFNSKGGNVYEARGLAKLIRENQLDTHIKQDCFSACTTAYIAGSERLLGENARLGFHQYRIDTNKLLPPHVNSENEQSRDLAYFKSRGIDPVFLDKVFELPSGKLWIPTHNELVRAGVVTRIGDYQTSGTRL